MSDKHAWKIIFPTSDSWGGQVFCDGQEVKEIRAILVDAEVHHPVTLTLTILPGSLEVEGVGQPIFTSIETRAATLWERIKHALAI